MRPDVADTMRPTITFITVMVTAVALQRVVWLRNKSHFRSDDSLYPCIELTVVGITALQSLEKFSPWGVLPCPDSVSQVSLLAGSWLPVFSSASNHHGHGQIRNKQESPISPK